jgi:hypothetical protein
MSRKYNKELIQKVLEELSSGKTVGEISKKYSVPSRRIYDWKNGVKLPSSNNVKKTDKSEVKKTITSRSSSFNSTEDILTQNGMNPFEWEIEKYKYSTWIGSDNKEHYKGLFLLPFTFLKFLFKFTPLIIKLETGLQKIVPPYAAEELYKTIPFQYP